ncbi:MAG TPA: hypothetical protein VK658_04890 [Chryseolinea sp.]|nr:hypothetical protein [Chryseolinea sp.]
MKRVLVVINKSWEADPLISALIASKLKPVGFPFPTSLSFPVPDPVDSPKPAKQNNPRAIIGLGPKTFEGKKEVSAMEVIIWCIEDLTDPSKHSSSSEEKSIKLVQLFATEKNVDLVIAFGTAAFNDKGTSFNGSVVIGSEFFTYNARPDNNQSRYEDKRLGEYLPSNLSEALRKSLFAIFNDKFKDVVESKLAGTPNFPAAKPKILAASNYVAISNLNITDYNDYAWADEEGLSHYRATNQKNPVGSIETTHGLIRLSTEFPTIFISAVSDRVGYFNSDVTPTQNYIASLNGGILLAHLLPAFVNL